MSRLLPSDGRLTAPIASEDRSQHDCLADLLGKVLRSHHRTLASHDGEEPELHIEREIAWLKRGRRRIISMSEMISRTKLTGHLSHCLQRLAIFSAPSNSGTLQISHYRS
ncbi:hypothetical protein AB4Y40_23440 [Paraburkholderia sp. EG287B]|uniref:hypothetical protein n=1 Tax=Paraburkholderia sp. EG287B TaxID=3237010 RepID=UPI0034D35A60